MSTKAESAPEVTAVSAAAAPLAAAVAAAAVADAAVSAAAADAPPPPPLAAAADPAESSHAAAPGAELAAPAVSGDLPRRGAQSQAERDALRLALAKRAAAEQLSALAARSERAE